MAETADARRAKVLRVVVDEYVRSAEPVGSNQVLQSSSIEASSATIRNDMASLEHEGLLVQPHVSAGRVPTDRGYRFYVDRFSKNPALDQASSHMVSDFFEHTNARIEELLHETSKILTALTSCTSVLITPPSKAAPIKHVQVLALTEELGMVIVVISNGAIYKELFDFHFEGFEENDPRLQEVSQRLLAHVRGGSGNEFGESDEELIVSRLFEAGFRAIERIDSSVEGDLVVNEASRVAGAFAAVDKVGMILEALEQQILVVSLMRDILRRGDNVSIGNENGLQSLVDCALVIAPYEVDGQTVGAIGVLGPTRMNYPLALAAVQQVSTGLGRTLSEG
ncbi:MAG: heat-inducible transcriptional repressor HrcA [Acidimicrobiales bacterium]